MAWNQPFFYDMGLQCIRRDGLGHVRILTRSVLDLTATTVPWPQVDDEKRQRSVVRVSNLAYSFLMPPIVIGSLFLIRRRHAAGRSSGEAVILAHLACVVLVAVLFYGEPRLRSSYDVFGLSLLASLVADWFGLNDTTPNGQRNSSEG